MTTGFALPEHFMFGASTAAHQIEGDNTTSDWWTFETMPGSPLEEPSGRACDSYRRWRDDLALIVESGLNTYRFSIEWARIEPIEREFSEVAIAHYRRLVEATVAAGIRPVLTLHHFTNPAWFTARGGWKAPDATRSFLRYVRQIKCVIDAGADAVITINEPNMVAIMSRVISGEATLDNGLGGGLPIPDPVVRDRLIETHRATADLLRDQHPGLPVGWSIANQCVQSVPGGQERAEIYRELVEDVFLRAAAGDDLIGVQSYTRTVFGPEGVVPQPGPRTLTGWEVYPEALGEAVRHTRETLPTTPVLVTENGIATGDDTQRINYTRAALTGLALAMTDGIPVLGYLHWSLLDNYEWGRWTPTFGLATVDRGASFDRTAKPSLIWLGQQSRAGIFDLDLNRTESSAS
ncbi:family 1 glycosylhydrolase [Branchiibius cervicis]|uniref:Family 1 glycosylhydrolase n=1 Tax=Branchiibius cervicis TaxID=908252 RepID=A0ABW2AX76_9MICO